LSEQFPVDFSVSGMAAAGSLPMLFTGFAIFRRVAIINPPVASAIQSTENVHG
jgi:hypothetical protein